MSNIRFVKVVFVNAYGQTYAKKYSYAYDASERLAAEGDYVLVPGANDQPAVAQVVEESACSNCATKAIMCLIDQNKMVTSREAWEKKLKNDRERACIEAQIKKLVSGQAMYDTLNKMAESGNAAAQELKNRLDLLQA